MNPARVLWVSVFCVAMDVALSAPRSVDGGSARVETGEQTLPPIGYSLFCNEYPDDCKAASESGDDYLDLTPRRFQQLVEVNRSINHAILPAPEELGVLDHWKIAPAVGDCDDYAVTKRHRLLTLGWPKRSLLLAEVVLPSGEHHLVMVVRTRDDDLLADNLHPVLWPWAVARRQYIGVRMQSPHDPMHWVAIVRGT